MNVLSIDLDYWFCCHFPTTDTPMANGAYDFINKAVNSVKKSFVKLSHEQFLDSIPNRLDSITNIDFHSDLINPTDSYGLKEIDEGNWINFVKFNSYVWHYPKHKECIKDGKGICGGFNLEKHWTNHFNSVKCVEGIYNIDMSQFDLLGICISPWWLKGLYGYSVQDQRLKDIFKLINYKP